MSDLEPGPVPSSPASSSSELVEVWASEQALISFDGRVIEVFGFVDAQRFHLAFRPVVTVGDRMVTIEPTHGGRYKFFYDRSRRPALEEFAALVASRLT
jgi:hypothetical protein